MCRQTSLVFVVLLIAGCTTPRSGDAPQELLYHDVPVPQRYRGGDPWPGYDGESKRYTYSYENAWWACIEDFAKDIDHQPTTSDRAGNGWPSEADGYWDGYSAAENRVASIIKRFGKEKARDIFQRALDPATDQRP